MIKKKAGVDKMDFTVKQVSSLQRVFLDGKCELDEINGGSALKGERFSYQIAYKSDDRFFAEIAVESALSDYISIRAVGNVPSELPVYPRDFEYSERSEAGLFPDVLYPVENNTLLVKANNYYALWITAELPENVEAGQYDIRIKFLNGEKCAAESVFCLNIIDAVLPKQEMIYTQWFHCDSIANYYNAPVFGDRFWTLTESFIKTAVHTGINMLLTPVFTPPLDTEVGGERLSVQLVDVSVGDGKYEFGFDKFVRWLRLAESCGIQYFEISHLFTQWGAKFAPKIIAEVDGEKKQIFGWNTPADSDEYIAFLQAFLPELVRVIDGLGIRKQTFFHISDEPNEEQIESYSKAKSIVAPLLDGFKVIDALSDYEFYKSGTVSHPIPCTTEIESFIERGFPHPWTYYCCGQGGELSNRFFGMPLSATRMIGFQLFKYGIEGFLQWGFNFYNSQLSKRSIDPFSVTDADGAFPSGDAFTVYPGENGALESVRSEVFFEALQDMRAMSLLAQKIGKETAVSLIENKFGKITFTQYPRGFRNMLMLRKNINRELDILHKM